MRNSPSAAARGTPSTAGTAGDPRELLLEGLSVGERQMRLAGIPTAVLEGGHGPPVVLLHGPGESAVNWRWVIPDLTRTHSVVAPDLPAHGETGGAGEELDAERLLSWLDDLIEGTCPRPPVLVGHLLGGAVAARFAVDHGERLRGLVLVDSLGLDEFRPSLRFLLTLIGFQVLPTEGTYRRFMRQCAYDLDALRDRMGELWEPFVSHNLDFARGPKSKAAGGMLRELGLEPIPSEELERIAVPTSLIWGRHDRALSLEVAEAASDRYGWPLHVIEDAADDPPRDQPAAFLGALRASLEGHLAGGGDGV